MRSEGDPVADHVITELFAKSEISAVNRLMRSLIVNEFPEPADLPAVVHDYLAATDCLPDWADEAKIRTGEGVFWRYGPKLVLILNCYSLPWDYLGQKGVHVLALTTRLLSNPARRITEVSQFLVDVMQPGGLTTPDGRGRRSIQKVRLMHAAIRRLAAASASWNAAWDVPINQEDLAGTLLSFSYIVLDGLEKLGVLLSGSDKAAYLHCWCVIGALLGIRRELLPEDVESARELANAIATRQFGPSDEGQALTNALVDMLAHVLPGNVFGRGAPLLIRYFLGKERAAWLGIECADISGWLAGPLRTLGLAVSEQIEESKAIQAIAERIGHLLIQSIVFVERGGNRPSFAIPAELREQWDVNWTS